MNQKNFQSICAVCGSAIPARYVCASGRVYIEKHCPKHGNTRVLASESEADFESWFASKSVTVPPRISVTRGVKGGFSDGTINTVCPSVGKFIKQHRSYILWADAAVINPQHFYKMVITACT